MLGLGQHAPPPNQLRLRRLRRVRLVWALVALGWIGCGDDDDDEEVEPPPTRVVVAPSAFLGDAACGDAPGAVLTYQATLIDVTDGYQDAFQLPSSEITPCTREVTFEFVQPGHRYIAQVAAFDRSDLTTVKPGLPLVIDPAGEVTGPRWTTTCFGYDDLDYSAIHPGSDGSGLGGADTSGDEIGFGGYGAAFDDTLFGVTAYMNSAVIVRGCEDLGPVSADTGVSVDVQRALVGQTCGTQPGQVERFSLFAAGDGSGTGGSGAGGSGTGSTGALGGLGGLGGTAPGAGGSGGGGSGSAPLAEADCGDVATLLGLSPNVQYTFELFAYESGATTPTYQTECRAYTVLGVIVPASCDPLQPVD